MIPYTPQPSNHQKLEYLALLSKLSPKELYKEKLRQLWIAEVLQWESDEQLRSTSSLAYQHANMIQYHYPDECNGLGLSKDEDMRINEEARLEVIKKYRPDESEDDDLD